MTQVQLFNKFKDDYGGINMLITTFVQHRPWYVRPITVHDTCCCHYHVEFELYYETFLRLSKKNFPNSPSFTICAFISEILCERQSRDILQQKMCRWK